MLDDKQFNDLKEALPLVGELSEKELGLITETAFFERFESGSIIQSGEECRGLTVVISGRLRAYYLADSGKEITLYRLLPGDNCILTMSCALNNITFDISLEAEHDSEIITIPTGTFSSLGENNVHFKEFALGQVSQILSDIFWVMEQVVFKGMGERMASYLLDQAALSGSDTVEMTHESAARDMGTAREVVSRMLKYFENQGLISQKRGAVRIIDRKGLRKELT